MRTDVFNLAFAYLRLSDDEKEGKSESASISNQRMMIQKYCEQHGIILVDEFVDATDIIGLKQNPTKRASL